MVDKAGMLRGQRGLYLCFTENNRVFVRVCAERSDHGDEVYAECGMHLPDWRQNALLLIADWERCTRPVIYATDVDRDVAWRTIQKHAKYYPLNGEFYDDKETSWYVTSVSPTERC